MIDSDRITLLGMPYTCWFNYATGEPLAIGMPTEDPRYGGGPAMWSVRRMPGYLQQLVTAALDRACPSIR